MSYASAGKPAICLVFMLLVLAGLAPAASAKPRVALTFPPNGADAGARIAFSYTAAAVPSNSRVVLQRQMGTAKVFRTVLNLRAATTTPGNAPALDLGRYRFRIAVLQRRRGRTRVLAEQRRLVSVYGLVPIGRLVATGGGTFTTPSRTFQYARKTDFVNQPETVLQVSASNSCRFVHIDWVASRGYNSNAATGTMTIVQEIADPVSSSAPRDEVSAVEAPVAPGKSWSLRASNSSMEGLEFYVNGTASCSSTTVDGVWEPV